MICDYCNRTIETDSQGRCVNCGAQHGPKALLWIPKDGPPLWIRRAYDPVSDSCAVLAVGLTEQEKSR